MRPKGKMEKRLKEVEIFRGWVKKYDDSIAVIADNHETFQTWLRKRGERYKDKEVKVLLVTEE